MFKKCEVKASDKCAECRDIFPTGIYLFKVNNRNTRTRYEICSKLTVKTPERRQWLRPGVFIVNFEHMSHFLLVFLLLTLNTLLPAVKVKHGVKTSMIELLGNVITAKSLN